MGTHYFLTPEGYVGLTDESPKGFRGVVFVGRGPRGGGPETVCEQAFTVKDDWQQVSANEVPDEWFEAIGYDERETIKSTTIQPVKLICTAIEYAIAFAIFFSLIRIF